jgi:hypothetical protein
LNKSKKKKKKKKKTQQKKTKQNKTMSTESPNVGITTTNSDTTSPRTTELNRVKSHLALARSRLALLTSAEGLSNFTLLVDEVNAWLESVSLPSNGADEAHAGVLRARIAKIDALGLLVDDAAAIASSSSHKKKSRSNDAPVAATAATASGAKATSLRRRKKKAQPHSGVTESEDEEMSESSQAGAVDLDADSSPTPLSPTAAASAAAAQPAQPAQPQLRAWKQRVNALSQSMDVPAPAAAAAPAAADRRQSSDDTLRKWKRNTMAMISAVGAAKPSELKADGGEAAAAAGSASASGSGGDDASHAHLPSSAGSSIRRWKREMSGEQADAFKRVIEERYGRSHSATSESSAAAAAAAAAAANDLADEEDDMIVAARESGVPKKASRRTDLLARFRREKTGGFASTASASLGSSSSSAASSAASSTSTSQILGVPLASLAASTSVPDFILLAVSHLEANGLAEDIMFNCSDDVAINELERKIERGELSDLAAYKHAEVVAALIKRFLMRLPDAADGESPARQLCRLHDDCETSLSSASSLTALLHQMACRELALLRFLLAFVVNRAKTTDVPYVCLWRSAEQLGQCLVRGSDARRSAASAVTFSLLRLYNGAFEPPMLTACSTCATPRPTRS